MKKLYIILVLLFATHLAAANNELKWVDEQVEAIKPPRVGLNLKKLARVSDPFIFLRDNATKNSRKSAPRRKVVSASPGKKTAVKTKPKKFKLTLNAILNKSAMINGKWYREGEKVFGYDLKAVNSNNVLLTKKKKQILLSTKSKSINLKSNNK